MTPKLMVAVIFGALCLSPGVALAQGKEKDRAKGKTEVPAWRAALPMTPAVRAALADYDAAEEKAGEVLAGARQAAVGIERAQQEVRDAVAARDETTAEAKERYAAQFEVASLAEKRDIAKGVAEAAAQPVLEELHKSPEYLAQQAVIERAKEAESEARERGDSTAEAEARKQGLEAAAAIKKFERMKLDEDDRTFKSRSELAALDEQLAAAKRKASAAAAKDEAVVAAEADVNKAHAAVTAARKAAKEMQAAATAAEATVARHFENVQLMARRARDSVRRRVDNTKAKQLNELEKKNEK